MHRTTYRSTIILRRIILLVSLICGASGDDPIYGNCDYVYAWENFGVVQSPNYPNAYPVGSACRYLLTAPVGSTITTNCTMGMPTWDNECSSQALYVSAVEDLALVDANNYCGYGTFTAKAKSRFLTLAYQSRGGTGWFQCEVNVNPQGLLPV